MQPYQIPWTKMLNFEPGTGMEGPVWNNTVVPPNSWAYIFRKTQNYQYATYSPRLMGAMANYSSVMDGMLHFSGLESNPAPKVISSGIRHLSKKVEILAECPAWTIPSLDAQIRISKLKNLDTCPAWSQAPEDYRPVQLVFDNHAKDRFAQAVRDEDFWLEYSSQPERLQLEHVFECRFAGPLFMACTKNLQGDDTTEDALILLDRIINNPLNLAWAPTTLNANKNSFFGGSKYSMNIKQDKAETLGTFAYLNAMAPAFKILIERIVNCCIDQYQKDSVIVRMLKILHQSPFCQGHWEQNFTGTEICWSI